MAIGVYFFKFPNNFCFGGVTGAAVVFAKITPLSASTFSFIVNMVLLFVGFGFLGKDFAIKTTYATVLLSGLLVVFERLHPLSKPLSNEPMLELMFAIALPAMYLWAVPLDTLRIASSNLQKKYALFYYIVTLW